MDIKKINIDKLKPLEKNPRIHSSFQIQEIAKSYKKYGQYRPVIVDENNTIICGHGFVEALKFIGEKEVSCIIKTGMSKKEKYKLAISDNKLQSLGADDFESIYDIIKNDISDTDIIGFDPSTIEDLMRSVNESIESYGSNMIGESKQNETSGSSIQNDNSFDDKGNEGLQENNTFVNPDKQYAKETLESHIQEEEQVGDSVSVCPHCGEII